MMYLRLLSIALLLGACSELVTEDDPRRADGFEEPGYCDGAAIACEDRTQSQCSSDCTVQSACHSIAIERCAGYHDFNACDSDYQCRWAYDRCRIDVGITCSLYESPTACAQAPLQECDWGPACTGDATFCFDAESSVSCNAILGCTWSPD
jgi:hypothetical protein